MTRYAALLRAVNVGRTGRVDMAAFCRACEEAGFADVESFLNSGNILLSSSLARDAIVSGLQGILERDFRLSSNRVALRSPAELQSLFNQNPFGERSRVEPAAVHVHFLTGAPREDADVMLTSYKGSERLRRIGANVFIDYAGSVANSGLTSGFMEKALGSPGTSRNWTTCQKLLELARKR